MSPDPSTELKAASRQATAWLYETALPLWLEHGVDRRRGGFYEALSHHDLNPVHDYKRLRVLSRQIYVFSQGAQRGVPDAGAAVEHGLDFLLNRARHPDGGFISRLDLDGEGLDQTRDLYDLAFVLFALAHAYRLTRDGRLKAEALALLDFIQTSMRHPAGGYVEALPPRAPRRQNPHMHLLEAALACVEHMPDPAFSALAAELVGLCRRRFMDGARGLLFEYFQDDLTAPLRPKGRAVVEPGHQMEWAWLLREAQRLGMDTSAGADGEAERLGRFALAHGLDPASGLLRGEVFEDGAMAVAGVRLWPHGEWLKAALRVPALAPSWSDAWAALSRFLNTPTPGLWFEQWDPGAGGFLDTPVPASSLYHIATAVAELERAVP
jgi:mannose-6-phosphate isomerase